MTTKVNIYPLESFSIFPYLVRTILYNNSDRAALYQNLKKAQMRWGMVLGVLVKTGGTVRSRAIIYKGVVQVVLIYGREIWVITDSIMKVL